MEGYTNFTKVFADEVKGTAIVGPITGNTAGTHTGPVTGNVTGNVTGMATLTAETVAAAGADHTDAAAVTKQIALVTAADGTKGVIISGTISPRIIRNTDSAEKALKVYPVLGESMNGVANAAETVAAGKTLVVAKVGIGWYTLFIA
jgi:hypothetical protein